MKSGGAPRGGGNVPRGGQRQSSNPITGEGISTTSGSGRSHILYASNIFIFKRLFSSTESSGW